MSEFIQSSPILKWVVILLNPIRTLYGRAVVLSKNLKTLNFCTNFHKTHQTRLIQFLYTQRSLSNAIAISKSSISTKSESLNFNKFFSFSKIQSPHCIGKLHSSPSQSSNCGTEIVQKNDWFISSPNLVRRTTFNLYRATIVLSLSTIKTIKILFIFS
jgi:hypothetical protein